MLMTILLTLLFVLVFASLVIAAWRLRRHQRGLQRQREALQKQRGAAHIREIAVAALTHTGRADIAVMLLQLSQELLEEAARLAPNQPAINDSLRQLHHWMHSVRLDHRSPAPVSYPEAAGELRQASMQLTEAIRLLVRLEARGELDTVELRAMQNELRSVQNSLDQRARMRRELETPAMLLPPENTPPQQEPPSPPRIGPTH